jgi:hypothetical protein
MVCSIHVFRKKDFKYALCSLILHVLVKQMRIMFGDVINYEALHCICDLFFRYAEKHFRARINNMQLAPKLRLLIQTEDEKS